MSVALLIAMMGGLGAAVPLLTTHTTTATVFSLPTPTFTASPFPTFQAISANTSPSQAPSQAPSIWIEIHPCSSGYLTSMCTETVTELPMPTIIGPPEPTVTFKATATVIIGEHTTQTFVAPQTFLVPDMLAWDAAHPEPTALLKLARPAAGEPNLCTERCDAYFKRCINEQCSPIRDNRCIEKCKEETCWSEGAQMVCLFFCRAENPIYIIIFFY
jgi:hypothetical protein